MKSINLLKYSIFKFLFLLSINVSATVSTPTYSPDGKSGSFTLLAADCQNDDWNNYFEINIPTNQRVNITLTTNTYDGLEITTTSFYYDTYYPDTYSTSVISTDGKLRIWCWDGYYGLPTGDVFTLTFQTDTPVAIGTGSAYIPGYLGVNTPNPMEALHVNGNIRGNASGGALRINTVTGYLDLGSMNAGFAHIYTDRPTIIMNKPIWSMGGEFSAYQSNNMKLQTNGTTRVTILNSSGNVGIGTTTPQAKLDVGAFINDGQLGTVLGRLQEGNTTGNGTFLGVKGYSTTCPQGQDNCNSFSIEHSFYGQTNSSINFYRGGSMAGGFITFNTSDNTEKMRINANGNVSIGTIDSDPGSLLTVKGVIHAREVKVDLTGPLADYVFKPSYKLMPLHEVEQFVKTNSHLPEIPSAAEVQKNGLSIGEMQNKLLQKIEELTLYVIDLQKTNENQSAEIEELKRK